MAPLTPGSGPVLVTGAAGFAGSWLVPELARAGYRVVGSHRPGEAPPELDVPGLLWRPADVCDPQALPRLLDEVQPAAIVHLAGVAMPREAAAAPLLALAANYLAVAHLLRALRAHGPATRLLLVSTAEVYGRRDPAAPPAREGDPLAPSNLYAATKAAAEQLAALAAERDGLDIVRARPCNHSGPRRPAHYAESSFALQIARAERNGLPAVVEVGNLTPIRDWSDVRDVASAYVTLLERGAAGAVYNVSSGVGISVAEVLEQLCELARVPVEICVEPGRYEAVPPERLALVADPGRLRELGWLPRHPLASTLASLLENWRERPLDQ